MSTPVFLTVDTESMRRHQRDGHDGAAPLPLRFQVGARTLATVERQLVRVALTLDEAVEGPTPPLAALDKEADGYLVTSLPEDRLAEIDVKHSMIAFVRQRYVRSYVDLAMGHDAYLAGLSGNARSTIRRKAKKVAAACGGTPDVRRFRTPAEMTAFHALARDLSRRTYQEKLLGSGLPADAAFVARMCALAAADSVRGWMLHIAGRPAAYLYCPIEDGVVRYDHVGHDPAFAELSPGAVLQMEALRDLFIEGTHRRFDFTEGEGQHKRQFASGGVACLDLLLLRPTLPNRLTVTALRLFDHAMASAKRTTARLGLLGWAKKIRR